DVTPGPSRSVDKVVLPALPLVDDKAGVLWIALGVEFHRANDGVESSAGKGLLDVCVLQAAGLLQRLCVDLDGGIAEQHVAVGLDLLVAEALDDFGRAR